MIRDLGIVKPGKTLYIPFHTYDSNDPSASVTITGLATTDIEIYKDGSVTQRASDSGYALLDTDGIDFDGTTGIHGLSIDLSDNTTANFYEAGSQYWVVLASITVDAATVNTVLATFTIGYPDAVLNTTIATLASQTGFTLEEGPADNDALNGFRFMCHDLASDVQICAGIVSDYVGSTRTVTLREDPGIFTMAVGDNAHFFAPAAADLYSISGDVTAANNLESYTDGTTPMPVNATQLSGDGAAADNAEAFFDGTGYAGTNNVIPTVTNVTNQVSADVTAVSGDTTAADNLELMFDGTGYTDDTAPASRDQVAAIGTGGGSALNFAVTADNTAGAIFDSVTFVGTQTNTFTNTQSDVGTFHIIDDATNAFDIVYRLEPGATKTAINLSVDAYLTSSNDTCNIQVYDHVGSDWETLDTINGTNAATVQEISVPLFEKHTAPIGDAEQGRVYVRFITSGQSNPSLGVARMFVSAISSTSTMGYENGSVWVDESSGTSSGTTLGVDGTFANQSDDFDNGQTIADNLGTQEITIRPGNSVTLSAALQGYTINNVQATLNGGSQNVDSTRFNGGFLTGTFTRAGTGVPTFSNCNLNNVTSDRVACLNNCGILGTFTLDEAGVFVFNDAQAAGATSVATIDFASLGGATVSMQRWSGDLTITGMAAGDTLNLNAVSAGAVILGGADGTVNISGNIASITDNRTGSPTLNDNSNAARFTGVEGATFDTSTDSLEAIRNRGDAAWTTGAGGTPPQLLQNTTIATLASQTSFTLTAGSADDDAYNDAIIVVTDQSTATQKAVGTISDYTGSTRTVTLSADPAIFTMAVGDTVDVIAALGSAGSSPTAAAIADAVWDEAQADHVTSGSFGELGTEIASILADTNELQGDDVPGLIAALNDPTAAVIADAVWDEVQSGHVTAGSFGEIATEIASILADTNELQTDDVPGLIAALNDLDAAGIRSAVGLAAANLDTQLDALPTTAEVNAEVDTAISDASLATAADLATVDANVDRLNLGVITGTAQTGTLSTTQATSDLSGYADDELIGRVIIFTGGTADGQASDITDYASASGLVTFTAITTAPANNDTFKIV